MALGHKALLFFGDVGFLGEKSCWKLADPLHRLPEAGSTYVPPGTLLA